MFQTQEQKKSLETKSNEKEISDLPNKEYKIMVIKMLKVRRIMHEKRILTKRTFWKIPNRNHRVEKYNNWSENFNIGLKEQTKSTRKKKKISKLKDSGIHQIRRVRRKRVMVASRTMLQ